MYDEQVKRLRNKAGGLEYDGWVDTAAILEEAADAIEELSMKLHGDEAAILGMKREIERMVVAGKPRWIPVTERLPEPETTVLVVYIGCNTKKPHADMTAMCYGDYWCWADGDIPGERCRVPITHWMPLPEPPKEEA